MMKKINIRSLRVASPRPEDTNSGLECAETSNARPVCGGHNFKTSDCSPDDSAGHSHSDMSNESYSDSTVVTPKRKAKKGILKTLRRKFTPSRKRDENVENSPSHRSRASRWHEDRVERYRSGSHSADRAMRTRHGEYHRHATCNTRYPGSLNRAHKSHVLSIHCPDDRQNTDTEPVIVKPKAKDCHKPKTKALFPFDTAYGHASAPCNGDDAEGMTPHGYDGSPVSAISPTQCSTRSQDSLAAALFDGYDSSGESQQSTGIVCPPPNVYDQVKDPPKESWSLSKELFKLSKFGWYWGPITRIEAEEKLTEQPDGAFLVRDSSDERYLLSLSFRSYGRTLHTRIEHCNSVFSFYAQPECEGYSSIVDLINHSMNDSQTGVFCYSRARTPGSPSFPVRLTKPVSRFTQVRSLQYLCRFVIRQYTRFDHIQTLPLPTSIKGWLQENQY